MKVHALTSTTITQIVHRTRGHAHGPITRLVSPGDVGELIKPFVFLDAFSSEPGGFGGFGWHPHSGIATLTVILEGGVSYEETTGAKGVLLTGGVEWMRASGGVWHTGSPDATTRTRGYQLWVALPPELENGPAQSQYLDPKDVPQDDGVRVILGSYGQLRSPIKAPTTMNYLVVELKAHQRWTYTRPAGHEVAWIAVNKGAVKTPETVNAGELAVFDAGFADIEFDADVDTIFVLGSAVPHNHDLVLGNYSVHTSQSALQKGEAEIRRLREQYFVKR